MQPSKATDGHQLLLLLGSNLGNREAVLTAARGLIAERVGAVVAESACCETVPEGRFVETEPVEPFLNQALVVETRLMPLEVLDATQTIEQELGRSAHAPEYAADGERIYRSRAIDIDILLYDTEIIENERLTVPHPRFHKRRFALEPAAQIAPHWVHPSLKINLKELFNSLLLSDFQ